MVLVAEVKAKRWDCYLDSEAGMEVVNFFLPYLSLLLMGGFNAYNLFHQKRVWEAIPSAPDIIYLLLFRIRNCSCSTASLSCLFCILRFCLQILLLELLIHMFFCPLFVQLNIGLPLQLCITSMLMLSCDIKCFHAVRRVMLLAVLRSTCITCGQLHFISVLMAEFKTRKY